MGGFNDWDQTGTPLHPRGQSGIWEGFLPGVGQGTAYKYHIVSRYTGYQVDKADPFAVYNEVPPKTASIVHDLAYTWGDREWLAGRQKRNARSAPISIYEVHLGSWMRAEDNRYLTYRELAPRLADYVNRLGFSHVESGPLVRSSYHARDGARAAASRSVPVSIGSSQMSAR